MLDHVHMLVGIPTKISISSFMGYLKGKSSLMMLEKHGNLKNISLGTAGSGVKATMFQLLVLMRLRLKIHSGTRSSRYSTG